MKTLIGYKENDICHLWVLDENYRNGSFHPGDSCNILNCGYDIYMASCANPATMLSYRAVAEQIRAIDDNKPVILDDDLIAAFIIPCLCDMLNSQHLIVKDSNKNTLPESILLMQNDKLYYISSELDFYEVPSFFAVGEIGMELVYAYSMGYDSDLPIRERIKDYVRRIEKVTRDQKKYAFHIDSKEQKMEKVEL